MRRAQHDFREEVMGVLEKRWLLGSCGGVWSWASHFEKGGSRGICFFMWIAAFAAMTVVVALYPLNWTAEGVDFGDLGSK